MRSTWAILAVLVCCIACGGTDDNPVGPPSTLATAATQPGTSATVAAATVAPITTAPEVPATYTVQAGDSLFAIAELLCTDLDTLVATNAWSEGIDHAIFPGDVITVPAGACAPAAATAAPAGATTPPVDATRFPFCDPGQCGFPYGDPADGTSVYADGPCTAIRSALRAVGSGPAATQAIEAAVPTGTSPLAPDEAQIRDEADGLWQQVIDAYGGLGDVPEGVTTSLGRAGAIEGDVAVGYARVLMFALGARGTEAEAEWDAVYDPLAEAMTRKQQNLEPVVADLDARCAPIGTDA